MLHKVLDEMLFKVLDKMLFDKVQQPPQQVHQQPSQHHGVVSGLSMCQSPDLAKITDR